MASFYVPSFKSGIPAFTYVCKDILSKLARALAVELNERSKKPFPNVDVSLTDVLENRVDDLRVVSAGCNTVLMWFAVEPHLLAKFFTGPAANETMLSDTSSSLAVMSDEQIRVTEAAEDVLTQLMGHLIESKFVEYAERLTFVSELERSLLLTAVVVLMSDRMAQTEIRFAQARDCYRKLFEDLTMAGGDMLLWQNSPYKHVSAAVSELVRLRGRMVPQQPRCMPRPQIDPFVKWLAVKISMKYLELTSDSAWTVCPFPGIASAMPCVNAIMRGSPRPSQNDSTLNHDHVQQ